MGSSKYRNQTGEECDRLSMLPYSVSLKVVDFKPPSVHEVHTHTHTGLGFHAWLLHFSALKAVADEIIQTCYITLKVDFTINIFPVSERPVG